MEQQQQQSRLALMLTECKGKRIRFCGAKRFDMLRVCKTFANFDNKAHRRLP
jgi:hypothetical protein